MKVSVRYVISTVIINETNILKKYIKIVESAMKYRLSRFQF